MHAAKLNKKDNKETGNLKIAHKARLESHKRNSVLLGNTITKDNRDTLIELLNKGCPLHEVAQAFNIPSGYLAKLAKTEGIDLNEVRSYTDIEIIYGRKTNSLMGNTQVKGLPEYDEATKDNFTLLLNKHENLIFWCLNRKRYSAKDGDESEIIQVIRIMLYYKYRLYNPHKYTFSTWMVYTTLHTIDNYLRIHTYNPNKEILRENFDWTVLEDEKYEDSNAHHIEALHQAIDALPAKHREVMKLTLQGFTADAIATRLNSTKMSIESIKGHVRQSIFEYRDRWFSKDLQVSEAAARNKTNAELGRTNIFDGKLLNGFATKFTPEAIERLLEMVKHKTLTEVAREFNTTPNGISSTLYKLKKKGYKVEVMKRTRKPNKPKYTSEYITSLKSLLKDSSQAEVAKVLNIHPSTVSRLANS